MKPKLSLRERLKALKELQSGAPVSQITQKYEISKALLYRLKNRLEKAKGDLSALAPKIKLATKHPKLTPRERLEMVEKVVKGGEKIASVCRQYGVSRTIFYRLLKRYQQAEEEKKLAVLENESPTPKHFWHLTLPNIEKKVLDLVVQYPELSAHKLVQVLPQVRGRPILSNKGVQNILTRHNLGTYEQRLSFSRAQERLFVPRISLAEIPYIPLKLWRLLYAPFATIPKLAWLATRSLGTLIASSLIILLFFLWAKFILLVPGVSKIGTIFATTSLTFGFLFFLYSLKYYISAILVLTIPSSSARAREDKQEEVGKKGGSPREARRAEWGFWSIAKIAKIPLQPFAKFLEAITSRTQSPGLIPDLSEVRLASYPFVSIHIPLYNEKKVAERILTAAIAQEYPKDKFEIIVADDSTDGTTEIVERFLQGEQGELREIKDDQGIEIFKSPVITPDKPSLTLIHRPSREGFKGGALQKALENTNPQAEYILIFDADFIPFPDTIQVFLKYFSKLGGGLDNVYQTKVAAIQGYQWHVLNKSENWVTRGVRTEYAGSYVVERTATEVYGGLKMIAGSVHMIRADILRQYGWGTSITEDFQLTLRLYQDGYKVVYTPYIQAPSECVSTVRRLVRQRMRWAEGHTFNIKRKTFGLLTSGNLSFKEKLEFLYLAPYYLQAVFFMIGTLFWFLSDALFHTRLPFWTATFGWSLVFTNFLSLPLMNTLGLFLEESEEKDYMGIFSFVALSYIVTPFQAYAAIKGLVEKEEGPWFRTPKTGVITDVISKIKLGFWWRRLLSWGKPAVVPAYSPQLTVDSLLNTVNRKLLTSNSNLLFATANNRFNSFRLKPKRLRWLGKAMMVFLIISSLLISQLAWRVPLAKATAGTQIKTVEFFLYQYNSATQITAGNGVDNTAYGATCGSSDSDPSVSISIPESGVAVAVRRAIVEWRTITEGDASPSTVSDYDIQFCNSTTTASDSGTGTMSIGVNENQEFVVRLEAASTILTGTNTYWFDARLVASSGEDRNTDSMKIYITYEYNQTSTTQLKTVRFYGNQQTGASSTTNLDSVINPNLTEGGITIRDSFAELTGHVNGADDTISASFATSSTCGTASGAAVADGAKASVYTYHVLFDMSNSPNLTSDNCIRHAVNVSTQARNTVWVITFEYSYYSEAEADDLIHTKTVRYFMGTRQVSLGTAMADVGSHAINLPENKPSSPFTSAYVHWITSLDAADNLDTCIATATGCTGTTSTQAAIAYSDAAEQTGGGEALHGVTAFFNTNWSNGTTFYISGTADAADEIWGTSAEIIITYKFNADTSSTIIKTVYFWVGQETIRRTTAFDQSSESQANFDTWWPETGTKTFRNGAVYANFASDLADSAATETNTITIDDTAVDGTDAASVDYRGTDVNHSREHMVKISTQVPATFGAQSDINFSLSRADSNEEFRSAIAYYTVETATSLAPEFAFIFIPLAIILPLAMRIYLDNKKRGIK